MWWIRVTLVLAASWSTVASGQGLLQTSDGKSSFFNTQLNAVLLFNFSEKSIAFGGASDRNVAKDLFVSYGLRFKATASDGFASLFEGDKGLTFSDGELGALVGLRKAFAPILSRLDLFADVFHARGSYTLFVSSPGPAKIDTSYVGWRITSGINILTVSGPKSPVQLFAGFAVGAGKANNYKYLKKMDYCEIVASEGTKELRRCTPARDLASYDTPHGSIDAAADIYAWFPATQRLLGLGLGLDFFWRYVEVRPAERKMSGIAIVFSQPGKPQVAIGSVAFQRIGDKWRLGLQAGVSF